MSQDGSSKLTEPQLRAVACLVLASSVSAAAKEAGVGRRSITRWLQEDAFRAELERTRAIIFNEAMGRLQDVMAESVSVLARLLRSKDHGIRLSAARAALSLGLKAKEYVDLAERVKRLEDIIEGDGDGDGHGERFLFRMPRPPK